MVTRAVVAAHLLCLRAEKLLFSHGFAQIVCLFFSELMSRLSQRNKSEKKF